jgi:hypothetical protein
MTDQDGQELMRRWAAPDALLMVMVALVNTHPEATIALSLTVPGGVVSGSLIQDVRWHGEVADLCAGTAQGDQTAFSDVIRDWKAQDTEIRHEDAAKRGEEYDEKNDPREKLPTFIHLADARFFVGDEALSTAAGYWRGRLVEVSGWMMGQVGVSNA